MLRLPSSTRDAIFVTGVVFLSLVSYAPRLGFYSDDWAFLGMYATAAKQTVGGFYEASYSPQHAMRPVQLWLCAVLYRMFGMEPAAYHWVNAAFVVLNPLLVYLLGRAIQAPRPIALAVALIYGLHPGYSTDRYWYVAFAITFSMTACLASLYADVRAVTARTAGALLWKAAAAFALVVSVLAYEVSMPLLLVLAPILIGWQVWRHRAAITRGRIRLVAALFVVNILLLGSVAVFKVKTTVRLGAEGGVRAQVGAIARHAIRTDLPRGEYGLNIANAVRVHFVEYGAQLLPNAIVLGRTASPAVRALAVLAMAAIFGYLLLALRGADWPSMPAWMALVAAGLVTFGLGYAIFVTNYNVQFTTTGIANRSAIAAALGAAMCLAGLSGGVASLLMPRRRAIVFAATVAVTASSGFLIVNAVAEQWVQAFAAERDVLAGIRSRFATLPANATLLLDGVCPYVGSAIVFEANWDLTGALQVSYGTRGVSADVVTRRMTAGDAAITVTIYGQPTRYPYSDTLFAYHAPTGVVQTLADAATARAWLSRSLAASSCPAGHEGIGVEPF